MPRGEEPDAQMGGALLGLGLEPVRAHHAAGRPHRRRERPKGLRRHRQRQGGGTAKVPDEPLHSRSQPAARPILAGERIQHQRRAEAQAEQAVPHRRP